MHQFLSQLACANKSDTKKKTENNSPIVAVVIAIATALTSSGFIFGILDDDDNNSSGNRNNAGRTQSFITSKTSTLIADLNGKWLFAKGDDMQRAQPEFDDSSWRQIAVPAYWEDKGFKNYDGYAWYRRSFRIEEDTDQVIYAFLGRIDDMDEVFINGQRIGGQGHFPPENITAWNRNRIYRVPDGVVKPGDDNVIAIRVYDHNMGGGIYRGKLSLFTTELPQPLIDLTGDWKFKMGDDSKWKNAAFDDSEFKSIQVPVAWEFEGHEGYNGFAWYRKTFGELPVADDTTLVAILGKIDDTDEVFINGKRIGKTGKHNPKNKNKNTSYYIKNRVYEFPSQLLTDSNLISVRVHDSQGYGGIYSGPIGIMTKEDFKSYQAQIKEANKWHLSETIDWLLGRS